MKKSILFTIDSLSIGGAEKSLVTLLNLIDYGRFDVELQLFAHGGIFEQFLPKEVKILQPLPLNNYLKKPIWKQVFNPYYFAKRVQYTLSLRQNNINHADRARFYWNLLGALVNKTDKHYDIAIGYGQCLPTFYTIDKVNATKKYVWVNCEFNLEGINKEYQDTFYKNADKIAVVSDKALEKFKRIYPSYASKMELILDIYDGDMIQKMSKLSSEKQIDHSQPVLMTTGRLNKPQKGYDLALEAAYILKERNIKFKWYAVGDGPFRGEMEEFIKQNHLEDSFILLGATANPYSYMSQCDVYIQTSREEGFGLTVAEARILNKPIVCTNFKACTMQMINGKNGLITSFDPKDIADCIESLLKDKELYNSIKTYLENEKKGNPEEIEKFYKLIES